MTEEVNRRVYRSTSLFPREPARNSVRPRVCNSAPTQVISDQEEDWNWGPSHAVSGSTVSLGTSDDAWAGESFGRVHEAEDNGHELIIGDIETAVVSGHLPDRNAGDFTDFMDSNSPDSSNTYVDFNDSDEPYEYWTKAWSYNRSPFSSSSILSFEDSEDDQDSANGSSCDRAEVTKGSHKTTPSTISARRPSPRPSRFSDLGPSVRRGWTVTIYGAASFNGPTSI